MPRTGLDIIAENQPLPGEFTSDDREMVYFLAEISIRTLLNRIHHAFYSNHGLSQQVMISLNVELRRQLESWLESIPFSERPFIDDSEESTHQNANIRQKILQIRYFAARQILYRPFILLTLSSNQQPEYSILENCRQCIDTAKQYLNCITGVINQPGPYTWTFSQSSFGTILTLIAAWQHPYLKPYLSDMKELLSLVISNLSKWEHSNPTIKAHVWILQTIEQKCFY